MDDDSITSGTVSRYNDHGSLPTTVITKLQLETVLPELSVAVYVTVVGPNGKAYPDWKSDDRVTMPELSEAVGSVHVAVAVDAPISALMVWSLGHSLMVGSSLSVVPLSNVNGDYIPEIII